MENIYLRVIILVGVFLLLYFSHVILKTKHPFLSTIKNSLSGIIALIAVNLVSSFTSVTIPISLLSLGISTVAGIPGVTLLLALNLI